jgi:hypothetical protein
MSLSSLTSTQLLYWLSMASGCLVGSFFCDHPWLGCRRRRSFLTFILACLLILASWAPLLWFVHTRDVDRIEEPPSIDWTNTSHFVTLAIIYLYLGASFAVFQSYLHWLCSTFTNRPTILSRFSGYIEGLKALGLVTAFAIDSQNTHFMTEANMYFSLLIVGAVASLVAALKYTEDSNYGTEDNVILPKIFDTNKHMFVCAELEVDAMSIPIETKSSTIGD